MRLAAVMLLLFELTQARTPGAGIGNPPAIIDLGNAVTLYQHCNARIIAKVWSEPGDARFIAEMAETRCKDYSLRVFSALLAIDNNADSVTRRHQDIKAAVILQSIATITKLRRRGPAQSS